MNTQTYKCFKHTTLGYALVLQTVHKSITQDWLKRQNEGAYIGYPPKLKLG